MTVVLQFVAVTVFYVNNVVSTIVNVKELQFAHVRSVVVAV